MAVGNFGSKPLVLVINDELLKDFYANEVSCQETSPMFINLFKKVLGGSLLVSTGDRWKRKRKDQLHKEVSVGIGIKRKAHRNLQLEPQNNHDEAKEFIQHYTATAQQKQQQQ